jgi:hypothetical protein
MDNVVFMTEEKSLYYIQIKDNNFVIYIYIFVWEIFVLLYI